MLLWGVGAGVGIVLVAVVYLVLSGLYRLGFWLIGLGLFTRKRQLGTAL